VSIIRILARENIVPSSSSLNMALTIGLIGGSGLLKTDLAALKGLKEEIVDTAYGRVFLRAGALTPEVSLVFVQRHDARSTRTYTQPFDINYQAIALALRAKVSSQSLCSTETPTLAYQRVCRAWTSLLVSAL
jgi:purine nucleoside phosphorylase